MGRPTPTLVHCVPTHSCDRFKQWCAHTQAKKGNAFSVLLIPGDIASNPNTFRSAIAAAKSSFDETFICAGNHDLWHTSSLQAECVGVIEWASR